MATRVRKKPPLARSPYTPCKKQCEEEQVQLRRDSAQPHVAPLPLAPLPAALLWVFRIIPFLPYATADRKCVCVRACMHAGMRACVRECCVRACLRARVRVKPDWSYLCNCGACAAAVAADLCALPGHRHESRKPSPLLVSQPPPALEVGEGSGGGSGAHAPPARGSGGARGRCK